MYSKMLAAPILFGTVAAGVFILAQTPSSPLAVSFAATTDNLFGQHDSIRIDLTRWSTNAERDQLAAAWNMTPRSAAPASAADAAKAGGGRGGGKGGGKKGENAEPAPAPKTPEDSLKAELERVPSVGELWTAEMAPYSVRYAARFPEPDGAEWIILITDRRLGAWNNLWRPVSGAPTTYQFSVIELRLNAKGEGEGKASVTGKVTVDATDKTVALADYASLPVVLRNVKSPSLQAGLAK
jgi:hypothetical protein